MLVAQHPIIHSPNTNMRVMFSLEPRGSSNSSTFFPRWKIQMPLCDFGCDPPQAAKTTFFHASVAVMYSGVCGLVRKTRCRPLLRSYVCRDCPTEVVIWNVALPSGRDVKGTLVGDTRPTVWKVVSALVDVVFTWDSLLCTERKFSTCAEPHPSSAGYRPGASGAS